MKQMKHTDAGSPNCDLCNYLQAKNVPAKYDEPLGREFGGKWAYTCEEHHVEYGLGNDNMGTEFTS